MAKKEPMFKGKKEDEIKTLSLDEFMKLIPSRQRRSLKRGFDDSQKKLLEDIRKGKKKLKTHSRDTVIIPEMIGKTIEVYDGRAFIPVMVNVEMAGHFIGEFAPTRKRVSHSAPGVGATRSSSAISVK